MYSALVTQCRPDQHLIDVNDLVSTNIFKDILHAYIEHVCFI